MSNVLSENERWIIGYEGMYSCSYDGDIYSYRRGKNKMAGAVTNVKSRGERYRIITLSVNGNAKTLYFHRVIAEAWLDNPDKNVYTQVDHIDRDKLNNCVENLRWVTPSENILHMYADKNYEGLSVKRKNKGFNGEDDFRDFIITGDTKGYKSRYHLQTVLSEMPELLKDMGVPQEVLRLTYRAPLLEHWNYIITTLDAVFSDAKLSVVASMCGLDESFVSYTRSGKRWKREVALYRKYRNTEEYTKNYKPVYILSNKNS